MLERIRRLEARGVIQGYEARINPEALGLGLLAFVFVRSSDFAGETQTAELLAGVPGGAGGPPHRGRGLLPGEGAGAGREDARPAAAERSETGAVSSTRTTIVLETVHENGRLSLESLPRKGGAPGKELLEVFNVV